MKWFFFGKKQETDNPEFWQHYLNTFAPDRTWKKTPLEEIDFIVFDTETTGLEKNTAQLLSIGAVKVKDNKITIADSLDCFIRSTTGPSETKAIPIHGILKNTSAKGLEEADAIRDFVSYCGNAVLVGHNVSFDISMINQGIGRQFSARLKNKTLDTALLAIRLEQFNSSSHFPSSHYTLDALCERYDIPTPDRHTAAGDAYITALLFIKLLSRLKKRGITTIGDLVK